MPGAVLGVIAGFEPKGLIVPINNTTDYTPYKNSTQAILLGVTAIFPKLFANGVGMSLGLGYAEYQLHATGTVDATLKDALGNDVQGSVDAVYDFRSNALQGELQFYFQFGDIARLEIGSWGGVGFIPAYVDTLRIVSPVGATFSDGLDVHTESAKEQNSYLPMTGAMIRLSAEIPLFADMALLPSFFGRAGVVFDETGIVRGVMVNAGGGVGLLFSGTNGEIVEPMEPITRVDTVTIPSESPVLPRLRAGLDLFSQDNQGHRADTLWLTPRRTLHRLEVPLFPMVTFEKNSAALPSQYMQYTAQTRNRFSVDSLAGGDVTGFSRHLLNIIGNRLVNHSAAHITLRGRASKGEQKWFSEARAQAVREYLTHVWGIEAKRVSVEIARDGERGNEQTRGVQISSDEPMILGPVVSEWIEQELGSTPIGLEPEMQAEAGIKGWRISVLYGDKELATIRQTDPNPSSLLDAGVLLNGIEPDLGSGHLDAELMVEDSTGSTAIARDTMPVLFVEKNERTFDNIFSRYILLNVPSVRVDPSIRKIADSIHDGAVVSITSLSSEGFAAEHLQQSLTTLGDELQRACREKGVSLKELRIHEGMGDGLPSMADGLRPIEITISQPYSPHR